MNEKIKAKWLKALRGGKYRQGKSALQTIDGKFCCLGVLCDLHAKATGRKWQKPASEDGHPKYMRSHDFLPATVRKWAGMDNDNGELPDSESYESLAVANDEGVGFPHIARLIEKHL